MKDTEALWKDLTRTLNYCQETGIFTWAISRGPRAKGQEAGSIEDDGYRVIRFNRKLYKAHRLAWFYCFKEWPEFEIDHINRNRLDNSLDNLRDVSRSINNMNSIARNTLNNKHVYQNGTRYMVRIQRNGKDNYLGTFTNMTEAIIVRDRFTENENFVKC